jgi:hypothetical protein
MARGVGERPERSPAAILSEVEYPVTRDELVLAASEAGAPADAINFLRSLPDRTYRSADDVRRDFAEGEARFAMFGREEDVHHRENLGKDAVETDAAPTKHP